MRSGVKVKPAWGLGLAPAGRAARPSPTGTMDRINAKLADNHVAFAARSGSAKPWSRHRNEVV